MMNYECERRKTLKINAKTLIFDAYTEGSPFRVIHHLSFIIHHYFRILSSNQKYKCAASGSDHCQYSSTKRVDCTRQSQGRSPNNW
jgi:hypothetical protein